MERAAIRTMVVDDSLEMLRALCSHLATLPAIELVGTATSGGEAVEKATELAPTLVLLDFQLVGMNGLEAAKRIKASLPMTKTVIVTIHDGAALRATVLGSGVDGFLSKRRFRQELPAELARLFPLASHPEGGGESAPGSRAPGGMT